MANDTDLLTSSDCAVSSSCHNGEIDRRQLSLVGPNMSSGAHNVVPVASSATPGEKLDSYVANGCVKLREGSLECQDVTKSVACSGSSGSSLATCDDEEAEKFSAQSAVCVDHQHSTANGFVPPAVDTRAETADHLTYSQEILSHQSADVSCNHPPTAAGDTSPNFPPEASSAESAEKIDLADSIEEPNVTNSSSRVCSSQLTALASDLSGLSIVNDDIVNPSVPCADSVAPQSDTKDSKIQYIVYESERQMEAIMQLITKDLSEPYSIYTYRYFIHNWPKLCYLVCTRKLCVLCVLYCSTICTLLSKTIL